jgi:hypothetical protein
MRLILTTAACVLAATTFATPALDSAGCDSPAGRD